MTLKEFLEENKINATPDQRSVIGRLISSKNDNKGYINEYGNNVKNYKESFLNNEKTINIIINYLTKSNGKR